MAARTIAGRQSVPGAASGATPPSLPAPASSRNPGDLDCRSRPWAASCLRAGRQPGGDLGPAMRGRTPARDEGDVSARQLDVLLVLARHGVDQPLHAVRAPDVALG